jgi:hypothetical protein
MLLQVHQNVTGYPFWQDRGEGATAVVEFKKLVYDASFTTCDERMVFVNPSPMPVKSGVLVTTGREITVSSKTLFINTLC